ncbi:MAG: hypothetical protein M1114_05175, partial [Candidatus Dependentiae bacterium]|nr:hypothetical protein [Candidatus Dependentiae bacterium]
QKGIINRGAEDYDDGTARIWNIALLEKLEHIAQQMNGTQIIAAWSITQQPSADIATSMLEILPTQLIDILITKASVPVSEKLKEILQKRYLKDIVEKAQPQRDLQEQIQPLEKFRQRILEQKKERQSTEQQTKRIMSGKEEYNDMPHRMPGTRTKSLLQRPKYKLLD